MYFKYLISFKLQRFLCVSILLQMRTLKQRMGMTKLIMRTVVTELAESSSRPRSWEESWRGGRRRGDSLLELMLFSVPKADIREDNCDSSSYVSTWLDPSMPRCWARHYFWVSLRMFLEEVSISVSRQWSAFASPMWMGVTEIIGMSVELKCEGKESPLPACLLELRPQPFSALRLGFTPSAPLALGLSDSG